MDSRKTKPSRRKAELDTQRKGPEQKTKPAQGSVKYMSARAFRSYVFCFRSVCFLNKKLCRWKQIVLLSAASLAVAFFIDNRTFRIASRLREYNIEPQAPAFEVVNLPGRGKGLIASRDIKV